MRLGLLDYCKALKDTGAVNLFPALTFSATRPAGDNLSQWFKAYRAAQGITERYPDFHSLRHNVRSALSHKHITEPTIDALIGHASAGSTGRQVYTHIELETVAAGLAVRAHPSLDLPRVVTAPAWAPATA